MVALHKEKVRWVVMKVQTLSGNARLVDERHLQVGGATYLEVDRTGSEISRAVADLENSADFHMSELFVVKVWLPFVKNVGKYFRFCNLVGLLTLFRF